MADYLSLEEAAKKLGIPTDRLVELRSQGQVRGFRDGSSWKFPEDAIEQLADDLADELGGGSGDLVSEAGSSLGSGSGLVIGGDTPAPEGEGSGSEIELGAEAGSGATGSGSDVDLVASESNGSDVAVVATDSDSLLSDSGASDLLEIDSAELQLEQPAITHDSRQLDLSVEPNAGSTGPVTDQELKEISESHPDVLAPEAAADGAAVDSDIQLQGADDGSELLGSSGDALDLISSDIELKNNDSAAGGDMLGSGGASSLELMSDLDGGGADVVKSDSRGADVLSELDLLSSGQQGSGLIHGDSSDLLASSGLGSSVGADNIKDSELSDLDDALDDDDELVIADDDDDLVISSVGSDISIAGDSGINLMSPSDSGLSLESEPLDLAGSSISALDLGAELSEGGSSGSGGGSDGSGSMVDFQADEEFQLSPSGVGLEADIESGSQVIEVEDSEGIAEPVELDDAAFDEGELLEEGEEAIAIDETAVPAGMVTSAAAAYEIPFSMYQCLALGAILLVMGLGGMLMTDLIRNMWAYTETAAPVSSLTDSLVSLVGWD